MKSNITIEKLFNLSTNNLRVKLFKTNIWQTFRFQLDVVVVDSIGF